MAVSGAALEYKLALPLIKPKVTLSGVSLTLVFDTNSFPSTESDVSVLVEVSTVAITLLR